MKEKYWKWFGYIMEFCYNAMLFIFAMALIYEYIVTQELKFLYMFGIFMMIVFASSINNTQKEILKELRKVSYDNKKIINWVEFQNRNR